MDDVNIKEGSRSGKICLEFSRPDLKRVLDTLKESASVHHVELCVLDSDGPDEDVDLSQLGQLLAENGKTLRVLIVDDFTRTGSTWDMSWGSLGALETLHMVNGRLAISTAADLRGLSSLKDLALDNNGFPRADSIPMADIFSKDQLTSLSLTVYKGEIPPGLVGIGQLTRLQSLALLGSCGSDFSGMESVDAVSEVTTLTSLSLTNCLRLKSLDCLAPLVHLKHLSCRNSGDFLVAMPDLTPHHMALTSLDLCDFKFPGWAYTSKHKQAEFVAQQLAPLALLTNLTELDLSRTFLRMPLDLTPLVTLTALNTLTLQVTFNLVRPSVEALIAAMPELKKLDLYKSCGVEDLAFGGDTDA